MGALATAAPRLVIMGVSGCGKSTVGQGLAGQLGLRFVEGDALHPPQNVARMAAGIALTDADRQGWLQDVARELAAAATAGVGLVVACSALKRSYRDLLRAAVPDLRFVHLEADRAMLEGRLAQRQGHYMPAALLQSQLDTLEPPAPDEDAIVVDASVPAAEIVRALGARLEATYP